MPALGTRKKYENLTENDVEFLELKSEFMI